MLVLTYVGDTNSNQLDLVAQLVEHWTSIPKVAGSIPTAVGELVHTQSTTTNNTNKLIMYQSNPRVPIPPGF